MAGHPAAELAADLAAVRNGGRVLVLFQPHLYSRTLHLAHEFAVALAAADAVCVTDIYPAREEPLPGPSPLWAMPQVLITPHTAGETQRYEDGVIDLLLANLDRLWRGEAKLVNQIV